MLTAFSLLGQDPPNRLPPDRKGPDIGIEQLASVSRWPVHRSRLTAQESPC